MSAGVVKGQVGKWAEVGAIRCILKLCRILWWVPVIVFYLIILVGCQGVGVRL